MTRYKALSIIALLIITLFIMPDLPDMGDFYNNYWGPAHLLISHRSPYDIKQLFEFKNALWMPQFIGAGVWIGLLGKPMAARVWTFLNLCSFLYIFSYFIERRPDPKKLGVLLFVLLLFPPLSTYVLFGQCGLILIAALLKATRSKPFFAPLFLLIGLGKPQLGFFFALCFFIHLVVTRKHELATFIAGSVTWSVVLMLPFWVFYPNWIPDFIHNFSTNALWDQPVLFNVLQKHLGTPGLIIWIVLLIAGIVLSMVSWIKHDQEVAAAFTLATTSLISVYIWSWDFVLLFPVIILVFLKASTRKTIILAVSFTAINFYFWYIRLGGPISDYINWPIPVLIIFILIGSGYIKPSDNS